MNQTATPIKLTIRSGEEQVALPGQAALLPGQSESINPDLAVANVLSGSIHGYTFNDLNRNGADDMEPRLAGVTFTLRGDVDRDDPSVGLGGNRRGHACGGYAGRRTALED